MDSVGSAILSVSFPGSIKQYSLVLFTGLSSQMSEQVMMNTVLSTVNQFSEPVEFYFHSDLTGHFSGLIVNIPDTDKGEDYYCQTWETFILHYPEFADLTPPPTFHEQNY
jgi:hypothetical protein